LATAGAPAGGARP